MTNGERVVGRCVSRAETRTAEAGFDHCPGFQQISDQSVPHGSDIHRRRRGIHRKVKFAGTDALPFQDVSRLGKVVIHSSAAADNNPLGNMNFPVFPDIPAEIQLYFSVQRTAALFLRFLENLFRMCLQFMDRIRFRRMERKGDHALHFVEVYSDHRVITGAFLCAENRIILRSTDIFIPGLYSFIRFPDRGEAACLRCHDINSDTEVHTQGSDPGTGKFQNPVFDKALRKRLRNESERHIMRADAVRNRTGHPYQHDLRSRHIIGVFQKLFDQFAPAFPEAERAVTAVAGVGIAAQDHFAAGSQFFSRELMNDGLVGRNIYPAVFFRG